MNKSHMLKVGFLVVPHPSFLFLAKTNETTVNFILDFLFLRDQLTKFNFILLGFLFFL